MWLMVSQVHTDDWSHYCLRQYVVTVLHLECLWNWTRHGRKKGHSIWMLLQDLLAMPVTRPWVCAANHTDTDGSARQPRSHGRRAWKRKRRAPNTTQGTTFIAIVASKVPDPCCTWWPSFSTALQSKGRCSRYAECLYWSSKPSPQSWALESSDSSVLLSIQFEETDSLPFQKKMCCSLGSLDWTQLFVCLFPAAYTFSFP